MRSSFSVVEKEVSKLAEQSKEMANSTISDQEKMLQYMKNISKISTNLKDKIEGINVSVENIAKAVNQVATTSQQVASIANNIISNR